MYFTDSTYLLPPSKRVPIRIGKTQSSDLVLVDASISREHAEITTSRNGVIISDKSKYGVFNMNEETKQYEKIDKNINVSSGTIRFGVKDKEFVISKASFIVLTSNIANIGAKKQLCDLIRKIGGKVVNDWTPDVTHLTMDTLIMTPKVSVALAKSVPIVSIDYWKEIIKGMTELIELPDPSNFAPRKDSTSDNHYFEESAVKVNTARSSLFAGKQFLFYFESHATTFRELITAAGGEIVVLQSKTNFPSKSFLDKNTIYVAPPKLGAGIEKHNKVVAFMRQNGRRPIDQVEIHLAILYCNIEKHCNPDCILADSFIKGAIKYQPSNVLAVETENVNKVSQQSLGKTIVPETMETLQANENNVDSHPPMMAENTNSSEEILVKKPRKRNCLLDSDNEVENCFEYDNQKDLSLNTNSGAKRMKLNKLIETNQVPDAVVKIEKESFASLSQSSNSQSMQNETTSNSPVPSKNESQKNNTDKLKLLSLSRNLSSKRLQTTSSAENLKKSSKVETTTVIIAKNNTTRNKKLKIMDTISLDSDDDMEINIIKPKSKEIKTTKENSQKRNHIDSDEEEVSDLFNYNCKNFIKKRRVIDEPSNVPDKFVIKASSSDVTDANSKSTSLTAETNIHKVKQSVSCPAPNALPSAFKLKREPIWRSKSELSAQRIAQDADAINDEIQSSLCIKTSSIIIDITKKQPSMKTFIKKEHQGSNNQIIIKSLDVTKFG